jgi:hypothetical protein
MENFALPMAAKQLGQPQLAPLSAPLMLTHSEEWRVLAIEMRQTPRQLQVHTSLLQGA